MQKQVFTGINSENESFCLIVKKAESGDSESIMKILHFLEPDMNYLAKFIKMPREDSVQEMKISFLEILLKGDVSRL